MNGEKEKAPGGEQEEKLKFVITEILKIMEENELTRMEAQWIPRRLETAIHSIDAYHCSKELFLINRNAE